MRTLRRLGSMILIFLLLANANALAFAHRPPEPTSASSRSERLPALSSVSSNLVAGRASHAQNPPLDPELARALAETAPDATLPVVVHLREQADITSALKVTSAQDAIATRSHLIATLQATADRSQAPLRAYLSGAQAARTVASYTPFWIFNGLAVRAQPSVIRHLVAHPDVAAIRLDHYRQWLPDSPTDLPMPNVSPSTRPNGVPIHQSTSLPIYQSTNLPIYQSTNAPTWNITRVRADEVWSALQISGTGAVVAGMDTGVDWLHPALASAYRGYNPHGPAIHLYNWYDATDSGAAYPVDGHGHGSHTMGTVVGHASGHDIGVAPGARWIGVRVLNSQGYGYDSWIHAGFQWLLAPGGDPAQAPDVVNCSWGSDYGSQTTFQPDLQALRAAGILPVFSNGNSGPNRGTVGSPASLPEAFAVGATDEYDEVANFSSRGPSPWGDVRPHVAAPGVNVPSSLPGGAYGSKNGTSMAAPHVAGIVALLRSVSPTLSITRTAHLITSTAVYLTGTLPNNDSGWGRVDAFAAVAMLERAGNISGTVKQAGSGVPIEGAMIRTVPHGGGGRGTAFSDETGGYQLPLIPTLYDVTASAFAHQSRTAYGLSIDNGETTMQDFILTPLPTGEIHVNVSDASSGQPITATIAVLDTPYTVVSDTAVFDLPAGTYTIRASRLGHRVVTATVSIVARDAIDVALALPPAPSILLVDSGGWYYGGQARYFRQALDDLAYAYDEWDIRRLPDDVPSASDLTPYDIVVWSAPRDAPGFIGADGAIASYLSGGGRLFLSGQDIGFWDGGGALGYWSAYYRDYLKTILVADKAPTRVLSGTVGDIFAGQTMTIAGPGGADNQAYPDVVAVDDPDEAASVLSYEGGGCGGVRVGTCLDYRVVYLSFGFEAINDRATRKAVMSRGVDWLMAPSPTVGLDVQPASSLHIAPPGSIVTHTVRVRHVGQGGITDTVDLSLAGVSWDTQISAKSLTLLPCTSATVVVSVTVPATATWNVRDTITLTAQSSLSPALALSATLTSKAPASILLVDDDRWYEQKEKYQAALESANLPYDLWQIRAALGGGPEQSPSLETLQNYPVLLWWTGYDWYKPVTEEERETLAAYLDGGGRLFLSSQDFLYHHSNTPFSRDYLGVLNYTEDVTPTQALGVPEDPLGDGLGPWPLTYPHGYQNWSDGLEPTPGTAVSFRDGGQQGIALARREEQHKTAFFAFPFEALPEDVRPIVIERVVGWLSWLGDSTFTANVQSVAPGDTLTYTFELHNDGPKAMTASLSNTIPASLTILTATIGPALDYDAPSRRISWRGPLAPSEIVTFTYRTTVTAGTALYPIANVANLTLEHHHIHFRRQAVVQVHTPELSPSTLACDPISLRPSGIATCTLGLMNGGVADASEAQATIPIPQNTGYISDSLIWTGGGQAEVLSDTVRWAGPLDAGLGITLTYQLTSPKSPAHPPIYNVAFLEDGKGGAWERAAWLIVTLRGVYLPVVMRGGQ